MADRMPDRNGALVRPVVERLLAHVTQPSPLRVYYDHAGADRQRLWALVGSEPQRGNTLAAVDILVADKDTGEAALIIEIEETGADPKKLLGDLMAVALSQAIGAQDEESDTRRRYRITPSTELWLCFPAEPKGHQRERNELLRRRLDECFGDTAALPRLQLVMSDWRESLVEAIAGMAEAWFSARGA